MRAIINGLLYDTEKAEIVWKSDSFYLDLYKTKNNRFFMMFNRNIIVDENKIKEFFGIQYPDKYIELFGEVEEA